MKDRKAFYKNLRNEIINDPVNKGYQKIFNLKDKNNKVIAHCRERARKIAELLNEGRAQELFFPIIRTRMIESEFWAELCISPTK